MRDPHLPPQPVPAINPLPWVVWLLALPLIAVEVVIGLGQAGLAGGAEGIGWRLQAVQRFAFSPDAARWMIETGRYPPEALVRTIAYPLANGSFTSALFAMAMLLALGKMVGEVLRWWAVLAVVLGGTVVAALAYLAVAAPGYPLFGTFPAIYALIGSFTHLLWQRRRAMGANRVGAFRMIGFLLAIQPIFALVGWILDPQPAIEWYWLWIWIADLAGFAAGFLMTFLLAPGGWAQMMARLRSR